MFSRFAISPRLAFVALAAILPAGMAVAQEAFPTTIAHAFGETEIEAKPERIVTIGWMSQDAVLALGVVPVGIPDFTTWGGGEDGLYPWVKARLDELGADYPELLDYDDGIPYESILALEPDLILARHSGLEQDQYERLSTIAPTVAYSEQPWQSEWRELTLVTGQALGRLEEAERVVAETEALVAGVRETHPEFAGNTFAFAGNLMADAGDVAVYVATEPRVQLMEDIGLTLAPGIAAMPTDSGFTQRVSLENLDVIDADVFIAYHPDETGAEFVRTDPLFSRYRPVAEGRYVPLTDRTIAMAVSAPSPLSIPYSLEILVPRLAEILE